MSTLTIEQGAGVVRAFDSWRGTGGMFCRSPTSRLSFVSTERRRSRNGRALSTTSCPRCSGTRCWRRSPSPEGDYRPFHRYVTPEATTFDVSASLRSSGYFSHATAVFAHGLTEQIPHTIYLNVEQSQQARPVRRSDPVLGHRVFLITSAGLQVRLCPWPEPDRHPQRQADWLAGRHLAGVGRRRTCRHRSGADDDRYSRAPCLRRRGL